MNVEWLISNIINGTVAIGTLSLAYVSRRQIKESGAKIHMTDLRGLVNECLNNLPNIQRAESTKYSHDNVSTYEQDSPELDPLLDKRYIPALFSIESHVLFEDVFHHFPNLKDYWNNFKSIKDYDDARIKLIGKIDEDVKNKKIYSSIDFNLKPGFRLSVYTEIVCLTKGEISGYNYETVYLNTTPVDKRVNLYYSLGEHGYYLVNTESDNIEELKNIHKNVIEECKNKYKDDIKKIIEMEKKLINYRQELTSRLENITHYVIPPKMDCEYVKS